MSIKFAILGMLSWKSFTGYELKKIFEESSILYWSGNNNQIYKALIQLLDEGLVTNELIHQDSSPSKKIYTITDSGLAELKDGVQSTPFSPEFKKPFLIQLAWSDFLNEQELNSLLSSYEHEIKMQLLIQQEQNKRTINSPKRTPREAFLWDMISKNIISSYKNELDWVQELRHKLFEDLVTEEKSRMNYQIIESNDKKYLELVSTATPLNTEQDALDLVSLCGEADTNLLLLQHYTLSEDFFKLKTGVAGKIKQKFINYHVKVAAIVPNISLYQGKSMEMIVETNKSNHFRIFESKESAELWLLK